MRVLLLKRQPVGAANTDASLLSLHLPKLGIDAHTVEASDWMPPETGLKVDRGVSRRLREVARDFEVIHAFGYRCCWACGEALGREVPWIANLLDPPKTGHPELLSRLDKAIIRAASSDEVLRKLVEVGLRDCEMLRVGVDVAQISVSTKPAARSLLGWNESPVVLSMGRLDDFQEVLRAMERVWETHPDARLVLIGEGHCSALAQHKQLTVMERTTRPLETILAADLVVVPNTRAGFSRTLAEAQSLGTPVLAWDQPAFREQVIEGVTGFLFANEDDLRTRLADCLESKLGREAVSLGGRTFAVEHYQPERFAADAADLYRRSAP